MINFIKGEIAEKLDNKIVIECGNIGYEIYVSNNTYVNIGNKGDFCKIYVFMQVREDGINLFGFSTTEEKDMFTLLITVAGIGAKIAIAILSGIKLSELMVAIASEDTSILTKIKGLGKKTAERIVLELKDKVSFSKFDVEDKQFINSDDENINEAYNVLVSLGVNKNEALNLARANSTNNATAEEIVSRSLKNLGR